MVVVRLKNVHVTRAKGRTYHYAWRGGPRLAGAPGSPEYVASYQAAHASRKTPHGGDLRALVTAFKLSPEYERLSDHSKRAYATYLDQICAKFGDMPFAALDDEDVAAEFYDWRDTMAKTPRTADYAMTVLKRLLAWGTRRPGRFNRNNHAKDIERLYTVDRSESIWTEADFAAFRKHASDELCWAVELAAHTGIRQGDLITLTWGNYKDGEIAIRTSKTGASIAVPVTAACRALLERVKRREMVILTTERGKRPWTADGLRSSFNKACRAAKVNRTFHDLRRTAATRLVAAGCSDTEVAGVMGWAEDDVTALKRRYVSRSATVKSMVAKLEKAE